MAKTLTDKIFVSLPLSNYQTHNIVSNDLAILSKRTLISGSKAGRRPYQGQAKEYQRKQRNFSEESLRRGSRTLRPKHSLRDAKATERPSSVYGYVTLL